MKVSPIKKQPSRVSHPQGTATQLGSAGNREVGLFLRGAYDVAAAMTYEQIGAELGLTGARVRQIEQGALRKLRHRLEFGKPRNRT